MRFRSKVTVLDDGFLVELPEPSYRLLSNSAIHASQAIAPGMSEIVCFGLELQQIRNLIDSAAVLKSGRATRYQIRADLQSIHAFHAILLCVRDQLTVSEEEYHIRVGFYRDHALELARALLMSFSSERSSF
jgi:hypothetical protein